jgi:penicillin G amidase
MTSHSHWWRNIFAGLLLILGGCFLVGWWMIWRPLPELDGDLILPGVRQQILVDRDGWGVPWIQASSMEDLEIAQGYVVAQDRLWQMDLLRRAAGGELAEIFGPVALDMDRENRTLGLRVAAEAAARRMDPATRKIVEAYAAGVNRYIVERSGRLPIEFTVLRYKPRPWTAADTFLVSAYMWKTLTTTWKAKLNRERITSLVGAERARDLFVEDSPLDHFIVGEASGKNEGPGRLVRPPEGDSDTETAGLVGIFGPPGNCERFTGSPPSMVASGGDRGRREPAETPAVRGSALLWNFARASLSQFEAQTSEIIGSNNFVVSGEHTASGKPILANDTHLEFSMPGIWYMVHLTAPGWNVAGFAFPGSPLVVIGHNDRIAWGFTNSNAEVEDLYVESFNPANPLEYRVNGDWVRAETRREVIHVRGAADDLLDVVLTRHGPVVHRDSNEEGGRIYSLRWTALEAGALDFSYPLIGGAQDWEEFLLVMSKIAGPGQNGIYADVDGNIGYVMAARIPIRRTGNGDLPVAGDTDEFEWTGYIPFGELPQVLNPRGGIIATANARTVGPAYKYFISDRWAGPYRTERIYELLGARKDLRPSDANNIQNDIVSLPDKYLAAQLYASGQKASPKDPRTKALLERLKNWDGRASADSVETSFVEYSRHVLMAMLLAPYIGDRMNEYELWEPDADYDDVWWRDKVFLGNVIRDRPAAWLPKGFPDYDSFLMAAADAAVGRLARASRDGDPSHVNWGQLHLLEIYHPLGESGFLRRIFSIGPLEQGGSLDTVRAMGYQHGPAMRFVADLSNWDLSLMEIPAGESGQYASPHYRDQFDEWFAGRGISAAFSVGAEERVRVHRLRILPGEIGARP